MKNSYNPPIVSSPGETLADLISERGWALGFIAVSMGVSVPMVQRIIDGSAHIDAGLAVKLGLATGVSADFWLVREKRYRQNIMDRATVQ